MAGDEQEQDYFREVLGINSDFTIAQNFDEAKLLIASRQGYMVANERAITNDETPTTKSLYLFNGSDQLFQKYYAYWKKDNSGYYIESFAEVLKQQF